MVVGLGRKESNKGGQPKYCGGDGSSGDGGNGVEIEWVKEKKGEWFARKNYKLKGS